MTTTRPDLDTAAAVLTFARNRRADADRAEADVLYAAVTWAEQHPPESIDLAATWIAGGGDTGLPLAGPGAPLVAEFAIAEFALAIGRSTDSGRAYLADAIELKYRLRRHWTRVQNGEVAVWRARRISQATLGLTAEAARFVDAQVAPFAHKIGPAQLDRLVAEAIARFMPDHAAEDAQNAAEGRHVSFHHDQVSFNGTTHLEGELDLADALDLDAALTRGAETLKAAGSTESLDVRRAMAAGELARHQLALDLERAQDRPAGKATKPRQVVLYVHLSEAAVTGTGACTDHTCVFPWCTRPARRTDSEHCIAHADGGTTCSCNIAPLCRRHHRLKTHSTWTYTTLEPGTFLWSSPHGYQFLRDHTGTLDVTGDRHPRAPTDPPHF